MPTRGWRLSFSARVYLLAAALTVAAVGSAAALFLFAQNRALEEALVKQGDALTESLAESVRLGLVLREPDYVTRAASGVMGLPDLRFLDFLGPDGALFAPMGPGDHALRPLPGDLARARSRGSVTIRTRVEGESGPEPVWAFLKPVKAEPGGKDVAGYVLAGLSALPIRAKWHQMLGFTLGTALALAALACLGAYLLARRIVGPLKAVAAGAVEVGRGNLDVTVPVASDDEVGQLARNFNAMARSLKDQAAEVADKTAQLARSERKYRELFERIDHPLWIADLDGVIRDCNEALAGFAGFSGREAMLAARPRCPFLTDADGPSALWLELLRAQEGVRGREVTYASPDGRVHFALLAAKARRDDGGALVGFEGALSDVTELKALQSQLMQAQRMEAVGTLAGGVAHDFNNLLAAIMTCAEAARMKTPDQDPRYPMLTQILQTSQRGAGVVRNLLRFARKGPTRTETVRPDALLGELIPLVQATFDRRIEIRRAVEPGLHPVHADPDQIHQVLMNLCLNARDALLQAGGGRLEVGAHNVTVDRELAAAHPDARPGPYVLLEVRDNGPGIPAAIRDRVLDPFFTTKEPGKGTGLGLSTAYGIVQSHGGFLVFDSQDGRGTTFRVYLPAAANPPEAAPEPDGAEAAGAPGPAPGPVVVLAEDEAVLRETVAAHLIARGYRVEAAADGPGAARLLERLDTVDLAILDLMLPGLSGEELLRRIRRSRPALPVLVLSGHAGGPLRRAVERLGCAGYLEKPCGLEALAQEVERILAEAAGPDGGPEVPKKGTSR